MAWRRQYQQRRPPNYREAGRQRLARREIVVVVVEEHGLREMRLDCCCCRWCSHALTIGSVQAELETMKQHSDLGALGAPRSENEQGRRRRPDLDAGNRPLCALGTCRVCYVEALGTMTGPWTCSLGPLQVL